MVSRVSQRAGKESGTLVPRAGIQSLVLTLSPKALFLGQAKRNREHWFDELPRTAFLIFKGKADLNVAS